MPTSAPPVPARPDAREPRDPVSGPCRVGDGGGRGLLGSLSSEQLNNSLFGRVGEGRCGWAWTPTGGGTQELLGGTGPSAPQLLRHRGRGVRVLPICAAGPRTPSADSTERWAATGPGWWRGVPSSRGRSPAGPRRRPSRPAGTLCRRWTAGGRWGREGGLGLAQGWGAHASPAPSPSAAAAPSPGPALCSQTAQRGRAVLTS